MSKQFPVPTKAGTYFVRPSIHKFEYALEWSHIITFIGHAPCLRVVRIDRVRFAPANRDNYEISDERETYLQQCINNYQFDNIDFGPEFMAPSRLIKPSEVDGYGNQSTELEELKRWKADATVMLNRWMHVWEALRRPGEAGGDMPNACVEKINRLRAESGRLRQDLDNTTASFNALRAAAEHAWTLLCNVDGGNFNTKQSIEWVAAIRRCGDDLHQHIYKGANQTTQPAATADSQPKQ